MGGEEKARINENTDGADRREGRNVRVTCLRILADQREQKGMKFTPPLGLKNQRLSSLKIYNTSNTSNIIERLRV